MSIINTRSRPERAVALFRQSNVYNCRQYKFTERARLVPAYKLAILIATFANLAAGAEFELSTVESPNEQLAVRVFTGQEKPSQLQYEVAFKSRAMLLPSNLGIKLANGATLGTDCEIEKVESQQIDASFEQFPGKRRLVSDRCTETTFTLRERATPRLRWQLVVRAYDDGVALRYHFPRQANWQTLRLAGELTEWNFPAGARATALPLGGFTTSHEGRYVQSPISELPKDSLFALPMLIELPDAGCVAIAEANLTDYAGMYLKRDAESPTTLRCELSPLPDDPKVAVAAELPHSSPWRVLFVGEQPGIFIESDLLLKLNAPSKIKDTSWIKPGKTTFPWWNGYYEEEVSFKPGVNTATAKHYIDFCAEYGIPYHSLDGLGDTAWYGGPIVPYEGDDITTATEDLDMPAVLKYAKQKGVRLRLWMHWQGAEKYMTRAFPLYRQWGIEGVMIDFMDRDDQDMVRFLHKLLQLAADNQLTVTFHGVSAPTGLERTYPNLLNSEAVMNLEYDKWQEQGIPPEHDLIVAQTRMLAGPLDYHQGSLRTVAPAEFKPRDIAPEIMGTPCRTLATYVVFQNHLPMMADYPTAYRKHPLTKVMAAIPTSWNDTRVLSGKLGEHMAIARRHDDDWWVGVMTNKESRELSLPLEFLGDGRYRAEIYQDGATAPHKYTQSSKHVIRSDELTVSLAEAGGALIHFRKEAADNPTGWNLRRFDADSPTGWQLVWFDDFDKFDEHKWRKKSSTTGVHVEDGKLHVPAVPSPEHLQDRTGQVTSSHAQRLGRWEVRAQVPATAASHTALRLLPTAPRPSLGEIDIMTSTGDEPTITNSEFHWGIAELFSHDFRSIAQRTSADGQLVSYPDGFHTYAVEWVEDQLRFYVDDVYHTVFYSDEVGDFLPRLTAPMRLTLDARLDHEPTNEASLEKELVIDWVKIFAPTNEVEPRLFTNGSFEANDGSLAGWHVFGNRLEGKPNIEITSQCQREGKWSLVLSGQADGNEYYSGVTQGIGVSSGQQVRASLEALMSEANEIAGSRNKVSMKIEFYTNWGDYFGGPAMLGFEERTIVDADTQPDQWQRHELSASVPAGAVEARLSLVFAQHSQEGGTVCVDDVRFTASKQ
jgi:alpha-glucosidase